MRPLRLDVTDGDAMLQENVTGNGYPGALAIICLVSMVTPFLTRCVQGPSAPSTRRVCEHASKEVDSYNSEYTIKSGIADLPMTSVVRLPKFRQHPLRCSRETRL
jgi:hypothetical protein